MTVQLKARGHGEYVADFGHGTTAVVHTVDGEIWAGTLLAPGCPSEPLDAWPDAERAVRDALDRRMRFRRAMNEIRLEDRRPRRRDRVCDLGHPDDDWRVTA